MFHPSFYGQVSNMGVRLSTGALACTTDSNWQFFRCCPVIKACLDSYKHQSDKSKKAQELKKALVDNNVKMVAAALEKEPRKEYCLNRRLTFAAFDMYTLLITPLCIAVFYRNLEMIKLLLKNGADPKRRGELYLKNSWKRCTVAAKLCPFLLSLEEQPDSGCPFVPAVASALLDAGADINTKEGFVFREQEEEGGSMEFDNMITPLHFFACRHSHTNFPIVQDDSDDDDGTDRHTSFEPAVDNDCNTSEVEANGERNLTKLDGLDTSDRSKIDGERIWTKPDDLNGNKDCSLTGSATSGENCLNEAALNSSEKNSDKACYITEVAQRGTEDVNECNRNLLEELQDDNAKGKFHQDNRNSLDDNAQGKCRQDDSKAHHPPQSTISETVFHFLLDRGADMIPIDAKGRTPLEALLEDLASDCHQPECRERLVVRAMELIRRGGYLRHREHLEWFFSEIALAAACKEADILIAQFLDGGYIYPKAEWEIVTDAAFQSKYGSCLADRVMGHWVADLKHLSREAVRKTVCRHCCRGSYYGEEDYHNTFLGLCCLKKLEELPLPSRMRDFVSLKPVVGSMKLRERKRSRVWSVKENLESGGVC